MIALENLSIEQGRFRLTNVSLEIPCGAYGVLMGPTGSGKTTLLEAVCGLRPVTAGSIRLPVGVATQLKPGQRDIGYVPQDAVLFPHMTIEDHLSFALVVRRWSTLDIRRRTAELAALLGIEHLLTRKPHGLAAASASALRSGGRCRSAPRCCVSMSPSARWTTKLASRCTCCWPPCGPKPA